MERQRKGVLLVNLGSPSSLKRSHVARYLRQFLMDRRVIDIPWLQRNLLVKGIIAPFRASKSAKMYENVWTEGGSPLILYGQALKDHLQERFGNKVRFSLAMRYQEPSIKKGIQELLDAGCDDLLIVPLFPQYASATTGSVVEACSQILLKLESIPQFRFIHSYYEDEDYLDAWVEQAKPYPVESYDHVLFSFHGLPIRQLSKADSTGTCVWKKDCCEHFRANNSLCYRGQCVATAMGIAQRLHLPKDKFTVCFQSRLGSAQWIQPYTSDCLEKLAKEGKKKVLIFSPSFVCDCLETTFELGIESKEEFIEMGGEALDLVPSLNTSPAWLAVMERLIRSHFPELGLCPFSRDLETAAPRQFLGIGT